MKKLKLLNYAAIGLLSLVASSAIAEGNGYMSNGSISYKQVNGTIYCNMCLNKSGTNCKVPYPGRTSPNSNAPFQGNITWPMNVKYVSQAEAKSALLSWMTSTAMYHKVEAALGLNMDNMSDFKIADSYASDVLADLATENSSVQGVKMKIYSKHSKKSGTITHTTRWVYWFGAVACTVGFQKQ